MELTAVGMDWTFLIYEVPVLLYIIKTHRNSQVIIGCVHMSVSRL
jgi:hypothetical protein